MLAVLQVPAHALSLSLSPALELALPSSACGTGWGGVPESLASCECPPDNRLRGRVWVRLCPPQPSSADLTNLHPIFLQSPVGIVCPPQLNGQKHSVISQEALNFHPRQKARKLKNPAISKLGWGKEGLSVLKPKGQGRAVLVFPLLGSPGLVCRPNL